MSVIPNTADEQQTGELATDEAAEESGPSIRNVCEFLIGLFVAMSLLRVFVAEAYLVPTGSMAPSLLGFHTQVTCPQCGHQVIIGTNTAGQIEGDAVCSNCSEPIDYSGLPVIPGDRLLVHKWFYSYRKPRRWETIVFCCPDFPQQAYVKRVVGLPGESVQIQRGNIYIDGHIARKSLEEFENLAILVHEHNSTRLGVEPRWVPQSAGSSWFVEERSLEYVPLDPSAPAEKADFIVYKHRDPLGNVAPVADQTEYTVSRPYWDNSDVFDVLIKCRLIVTERTGKVVFRLQPVGDREFHLTLDFANLKAVLESNGETVRSASLGADEGTLELAFGCFDERVVASSNGEELFEPLDLQQALPNRPTPNSTPFAIGSCGQQVRVENVRIYRDVYYSARIAGSYKPAGVVKPYKLARNEYFVLGDNSVISQDSRAWDRPAVAAHLLVGKPLFVHLPSLGWQVELFGRKFRRPLPDVTRIRRIH